MGKNAAMKQRPPYGPSVVTIWELARSGEFRDGAQAARKALAELGAEAAQNIAVELHLVVAFCSMRQGDHPEALRELDAATRAASSPEVDPNLVSRVETWRAELAYFQGRYSEANVTIDRLLARLEQNGDFAYAAFALRIRIAILLARADYDSIAGLADRAIGLAEASGDKYVIVQILNILGAVQFDRATSKLREPHARAHLSSIDPREAASMEDDARAALRLFERARTVAKRAKYQYAAWYVAGNIERLEILLGRADRAVRAIRKRLGALQARGAKYDEIVTRSNLAWGLRTLGRYSEALHELDVALTLARGTGTLNVLLEFLEYDRSIVLDALGNTTAARASYRRYLQLVGAWNRKVQVSQDSIPTATRRRPLEPFFLKRADRYVLEHIGEAFSVSQLAEHCGVSWRTLEQAFTDFRGITPVAHIRNVRLDRARNALGEGPGSVAEIAKRYGFQSSTTFALEFRKRFGMPPRRIQRARPS